MTFIVETFINPNKLMKPNSLIKFLDVDYNPLLTELTQAYADEFSGDSYTINRRLKLKRNVNTIILDLFDAYTILAADAPRLSNNLTNIRAQLDTFKITNVLLKNELAQMYEMREGSSELINDYKQLYNINYTRNWGILLSIIFSCYVLTTMFKSKPIII